MVTCPPKGIDADAGITVDGHRRWAGGIAKEPNIAGLARSHADGVVADADGRVYTNVGTVDHVHTGTVVGDQDV
jgi:hypothetical protein